MASPSSEPGNESVPHGIIKLNDSVWQLHAPPSTEIPIVDVVFFHGLQLGDYENAFWKTWLVRSEKDSILWPKDWLGSDLPGARILSVSYDSSARQQAGKERPEPFVIAENLRQLILDAEVGQKCPVILVGHSLGGLIIKLVLLKCLERKDILEETRGATKIGDREVKRIENFVQNCRGAFYYSTPGLGSVIAVAGSRIGEFLIGTDLVRLNTPLMKLLKVLSEDTGKINSDFDLVEDDLYYEGFYTSAIGEGLDSKYFGLSLRVVEEESVKFSCNASYSGIVDSDHFQVCRPTDQNGYIYTVLLVFIKDKAELWIGDRS